jgi:hypothetical protein
MATTNPLTSVSSGSQARGADDRERARRLIVNDSSRATRIDARETMPTESQVSLQRALRTLRAVRQRYETGRNAHADARFYGMHVVVDHGDVAWIAAAIEAVEKAIRASHSSGVQGDEEQSESIAEYDGGHC